MLQARHTSLTAVETCDVQFICMLDIHHSYKNHDFHCVLKPMCCLLCIKVLHQLGSFACSGTAICQKTSFLICWCWTGSVFTGTAINPARALGPAIVFHCHWNKVWVYVIAGETVTSHFWRQVINQNSLHAFVGVTFVAVEVARLHHGILLLQLVHTPFAW